ncbi:MAG: sigma-70 family RNA polymerase sigma factor [Oscillospiraceae bacterium]|nr:sigma-70 family RNA polymerase sigma factor [Oscillospiraceae bacterium]
MDNTAFEQLYLACEPALKRFVTYKLPSTADADDVLQEVAIAACRNMHSVKNPESFKPWLLKIAANKCNDFYRAMAKRHEIAFDDTVDTVVSMSRYGISDTEMVRDTLDNLADKDKQILFLFYFKQKPQAEIAQLLHIPLGTVKSRLHIAKQNFKQAYPFPPQPTKGENTMKTLPNTMPAYTITPCDKPPFAVKWEEMMGWFIVPKLGETISWAMYDFPARKRTDQCTMQVTGKAMVHGIEGVEISATDHDVPRSFVAQLTDTHCRILAESHSENGVKKFFTFLDVDDFIPNWGFGENNCGNETNLHARGTVTKQGSEYTCRNEKQVMDVVGRFTVQLGDKTYDTICVVDSELYNNGVFSEQYIDQNGKTVLWRRFNRNDWNIKRYNQNHPGGELWSEMFPQNQQITVNGETYVHWYDCITDYVL